MKRETNNSKDYYSQSAVAKNYDTERFNTKAGKKFNEFEISVVNSNLPPIDSEGTILDAGAGSGRFTLELAKKGFNVISCDYSSEMLKIIKSKIKENDLEDQVTLRKEDITKLTFDNNQFDYVCSIRVTVNLDTVENVQRAINELIRVCKPGGTIVFDIVNPLSLAAFGPKKSSMITFKKVKKMISSHVNIKIKKIFGRRLLSQTAFEKTPIFLLGFVDKLDHYLSKFFPFLCVRVYFVIKKNNS